MHAVILGVASGLSLALASMPATQAKPTTLVFAKVSADGDPIQMATRYGKLMRALSKDLGLRVVFQTRKTYEDFSKGMADGRFDIVSAGPIIYLAHEKAYEPVAKPVRRGQATYRGMVLVREDGPIRQIRDLKGSRIGFANKKSTSGYLLPVLMLAEEGLELERDFPERVSFYGGNHTEVVQAVTRGTIDAGAVYDDARVAAYGEDMTMRAKTRVLFKTPDIPNAPIMVPKRMDSDLKARIASFFKSCAQRPDAHALFKPIDEELSGWVAASPQDYQVVRKYRAAFNE